MGIFNWFKAMWVQAPSQSVLPAELRVQVGPQRQKKKMSFKNTKRVSTGKRDYSNGTATMTSGRRYQMLRTGWRRIEDARRATV